MHFDELDPEADNLLCTSGLVRDTDEAAKAVSASSSPASIVFKSANTILSGCAALMAVTAESPALLMSGVPSSRMST